MLKLIWRSLPTSMKRAANPLRQLVQSKTGSELGYWIGRHKEEGRFANHFYRKIMLGMAEQADAEFVKGKVVADFGCGPRGTLTWAEDALAIGIDVLVPEYADAFPDDMRSHGMIYVTSTEKVIPLPDNSVDILFTLNAFDHASDIQAMADELCRILKPGGQFCGSFNLYEYENPAEPNFLTEELMDEVLLSRFAQSSLRFGTIQPDHYSEMYTDAPSSYVKGKPGYMWFNGTLK